MTTMRKRVYKAFKKVEFFNNIKLSDIDKHIPILLELVSVATKYQMLKLINRRRGKNVRIK